MDFTITSYSLQEQTAQCVIIGVYQDKILTPQAEQLDILAGDFIKKLIKSDDISGKLNAQQLLFDVPGISFKKVLIVGLGKKQDFNENNYNEVWQTSCNFLKNSKITSCCCLLTDVDIPKRDLAWKYRQAVIIINKCFYNFTQCLSVTEQNDVKSTINIVKHINFIGSNNVANNMLLQEALDQGKAISSGMHTCKDLANLPANICTPSYLADHAKSMAVKHNIKCTVLEENQIESLKMGSFLGVAKGSEQPPKLIVLEYRGADAAQQPIALIGKGITFDTGGISLKPADAMLGMKFDMCGAATVIGVMQAVAILKLPINVVGVIPTCENMPSGKANKPDDIVTSMSGKTIEIGNTDAEGRLILCDALTYSAKFKPKVMIDIATLTGAIVITLGKEASGLFSNNQQLADDLLAAGNNTFDRVWQLPIWPEYHKLLNSPVADMNNVGGREAGSISAACFLEKFIEDKTPWAHLDIAGTAAYGMTAKSMATGRPVPMLTQFIIDQASKV